MILNRFYLLLLLSFSEKVPQTMYGQKYEVLSRKHMQFCWSTKGPVEEDYRSWNGLPLMHNNLEEIMLLSLSCSYKSETN